MKLGQRLITAAAAAFVASTITAPTSTADEVVQETPEFWFESGQKAVHDAKELKKNTRRAKNVILFIGDGMGVSTVTAARILAGQMQGRSGEENQLSFEKFPYLALSKTYSVNQQTSDSAPTMTAMVTGVKTLDGVLSLNQNVERGNYASAAGNELATILEQAEDRGLSSGVVSTARITHATPAACYAHSPERDWESDANLPADALTAGFPDIARQLVELKFNHGDGLEVALGGGRSNFIPTTLADPEDAGRFGSRKDGWDLTAEWVANHPNAAYVWNQAQFDAIDPDAANHLLGLFERSHVEYEFDRPNDAGGEPSLTELTEKAIQILDNNKKGFFLMVEGGRIDHAHHAGNAFRALTETIELAKAVEAAKKLTDSRETLIVVSADHSHVFTIAGYPARGDPILGLVREPGESEFAKDLLGLPYTTVSYSNGPGYTGASSAQPAGIKVFPHAPTGYSGITAGRPDLSGIDTSDPKYLQEATIPFGAETHAGEEVAIYAEGPKAHLFHGVQEQNVIYHVMADALRLN